MLGAPRKKGQVLNPALCFNSDNDDLSSEGLPHCVSTQGDDVGGTSQGSDMVSCSQVHGTDQFYDGVASGVAYAGGDVVNDKGVTTEVEPADDTVPAGGSNRSRSGDVVGKQSSRRVQADLRAGGGTTRTTVHLNTRTTGQRDGIARGQTGNDRVGIGGGRSSNVERISRSVRA